MTHRRRIQEQFRCNGHQLPNSRMRFRRWPSSRCRGRRLISRWLPCVKIGPLSVPLRGEFATKRSRGGRKAPTRFPAWTACQHKGMCGVPRPKGYATLFKAEMRGGCAGGSLLRRRCFPLGHLGASAHHVRFLGRTREARPLVLMSGRGVVSYQSGGYVLGCRRFI